MFCENKVNFIKCVTGSFFSYIDVVCFTCRGLIYQKTVAPYLPQLMADIVYRSGFTAELSGRTNTAIQADTSGGTCAPPSAANPMRMIGTYKRKISDASVMMMELRDTVYISIARSRIE